ncbi:rho guanine nucleotide exchange factor 17-like [Limulus polyphemus]|uniref:Rho guanine nucleotide exchange factor 17-like n=1 Tax=Limulus polyphemus TaxID=6850 RepID=A0ABM1SBR0_LIMPO|nr:rho guanine nucleotide exchange factor 17-like [Limulus polyphemus]
MAEDIGITGIPFGHILVKSSKRAPINICSFGLLKRDRRDRRSRVADGLWKELLKHTHVDHPDYQLLVLAQKEIHDLAVKINRMEREAFQHERMLQRMKELEHLIEGAIDLVQPDRTFIRYDVVYITGGLGIKNERCIFLFSDLLIITSIKRKSGTIRKPSSSSNSPSSFGTLETNKYKMLMMFSLDNLAISKNSDANIKKAMKEIQNLEDDISLLGRINELIGNLNCQHQILDEAIEDVMGTVSKQLLEKQTTDPLLLSLQLTATLQEGEDTITITYPTPEKRSSWEAAFNEVKQKLAHSTDKRPPPDFLYTVPIHKTRAGLQFTCAASVLGLNQLGHKDIWVCNSDGYTGQVCVISLQPEPTLTSCSGICNARITCITSIPAANSVEASTDDDADDFPDDDSSKKLSNEHCLSREDSRELIYNNQPTMWLGTEDGCIHIYNCNDNISIKKHRLKIQHSASVHCILYLDNRVFVALANGEVCVYHQNFYGSWNTTDPQHVLVGSVAAPVTKMLATAGKMWCGCQGDIKVLNTTNLEIEHSFQVTRGSSKTMFCMVASDLGVWLAIQNSAILKLFHATTYEDLLEVNVSPAVTKMLSRCDDIIRQHKAACLRVTALLACKDMLWIGTSAGVILTIALPHLTITTSKLDHVPKVSGIPHGHTGHVRFLTYVEMTPDTDMDIVSSSKYMYAHQSNNRKDGETSRTFISSPTSHHFLVISGGDGYENFSVSGPSETIGQEDSTNHLLFWKV